MFAPRSRTHDGTTSPNDGGTVFTLTSEIVAAEGNTAVARLEIVYEDPPQRTYRDLWIITLSSDGRCREFEEWPFHPGQARTAL